MNRASWIGSGLILALSLAAGLLGVTSCSSKAEHALDKASMPVEMLAASPRAPGPMPPLAAEGEEDEGNREAYDRIADNPFVRVEEEPLSTFSIDVDTASYANVRRFLREGSLPPPDAVRIEELLNYFTYDYPAPEDVSRPFSVAVEVAAAPWAESHRLVRIGLKGREIPEPERPASNLVFLLDVSGSMNSPNKLPLVKQAFRLLVERLRPEDRVAIAVYAGASGLVLAPTPGDRKSDIALAMDRLEAGGSTNGGAGIELAYRTAEAAFIKGGANRVILATDGDFNVGVTNQGDLARMIEEKARTGVFLTVLGFGMGNLNDSTLEKLADRGNGNYAYVDTVQEARKVFVEQIQGTLITIAKDVKIQIEFNPTRVAAYRLIGYENRVLRHQEFNDDSKDAGEIGAGHTVTALYEVVPLGQDLEIPRTDPLRYQEPRVLSSEAESGELLTVKLRYKAPDADSSELAAYAVADSGRALADASGDFKFAAAVSSFGMLLRRSEYRGSSSYDQVLALARAGASHDPHGHRGEFLELVERARGLDGRPE